MPLRMRQQILLAAEGLFLTFFLLFTPALALQENWIDHITQRVKTAHDPNSLETVDIRHYLAQLLSIHQALVQENIPVVQAQMSRLVQMVAVKEGGLSEASAQSLLLDISDVTPIEYLDETTKSRLRLVRQMATFRTETIGDIPEDLSYGVTVAPRTMSWNGGRFGSMHPVVTLGAGVLVLVGLGAIIFLFLGLGDTAPNGRSAIQPTRRPRPNL